MPASSSPRMHRTRRLRRRSHQHQRSKYFRTKKCYGGVISNGRKKPTKYSLEEFKMLLETEFKLGFTVEDNKCTQSKDMGSATLGIIGDVSSDSPDLIGRFEYYGNRTFDALQYAFTLNLPTLYTSLNLASKFQENATDEQTKKYKLMQYPNAEPYKKKHPLPDIFNNDDSTQCKTRFTPMLTELLKDPAVHGDNTWRWENVSKNPQRYVDQMQKTVTALQENNMDHAEVVKRCWTCIMNACLKYKIAIEEDKGGIFPQLSSISTSSRKLSRTLSSGLSGLLGNNNTGNNDTSNSDGSKTTGDNQRSSNVFSTESSRKLSRTLSSGFSGLFGNNDTGNNDTSNSDGSETTSDNQRSSKSGCTIL